MNNDNTQRKPIVFAFRCDICGGLGHVSYPAPEDPDEYATVYAMVSRRAYKGIKDHVKTHTGSTAEPTPQGGLGA